MLYKDILKDFASRFDVEEVMIIPSSVEEGFEFFKILCNYGNL